MISALIQASSHSHFSSLCQCHMMSSSQKGPQRAKQISQMEIMTTLIKQWHHHPESRRSLLISLFKLREESTGRGPYMMFPRWPPFPAVSVPLTFITTRPLAQRGVRAVGKASENASSQGALRTGCSDRGGMWLAEHSQAFLS